MLDETLVIGKIYTFSAAHHLPGHPKCGKVHGHTYSLTVEIEGGMNDLGVILDFSILNKVMDDILKPLDHNDLNTVFEITTCEHMAKELARDIWEAIRELKIPQLLSVTVILKEGEGGYARAVHTLFTK
jgi:6-pyruvoyltetrahydropterin/6-carboxytetrahydropterin synthase